MTKYILSLILLSAITLTGFSQTIEDALGNKDTLTATRLIKEGQNVNALNDEGVSVLMTACRWGDSLVVKYLLKHGATVNEPLSNAGRTPLMVGCSYYARMNVITLLIKAGAKVNLAENNGKTALILAASSGKVEIVNYLLKMGADPKIKDKAGKTALDYAKAAEIDAMLIKMLQGIKVDKAATVAALEKVTR